jgi:3-oxoacyl-ACP reductase-like protein
MCTHFIIAGLMVALSPLSMAGQIYQWVDAQGVTHFDAQPPRDQPATTIVTPASQPGRSGTGARNGAIGDQQAIDKSVKKQVSEQQNQLKVFCEQARTNLAQLQNNPRLREEVDGQMRRLDDSQRQERIGETQMQIADNCM